jgi:hypothetical protein
LITPLYRIAIPDVHATPPGTHLGRAIAFRPRRLPLRRRAEEVAGSRRARGPPQEHHCRRQTDSSDRVAERNSGLGRRGRRRLSPFHKVRLRARRPAGSRPAAAATAFVPEQVRAIDLELPRCWRIGGMPPSEVVSAAFVATGVLGAGAIDAARFVHTTPPWGRRRDRTAASTRLAHGIRSHPAIHDRQRPPAPSNNQRSP